MSRTSASTKNLTAAIRAPFRNQGGLGPVANSNNATQIAENWAADNTFSQQFLTAAGTDVVRAVTVNASNQLLIGEALATSERKTIKWQIQDNGSISTQAFFIADQGYRIVGITWIHTTKSSVAGTAYVEKTATGLAPGSGVSLMTGTFDLTAANATVLNATLNTATNGTQTGTGDSFNPPLYLVAGDALTVVVAGTITSLAGVEITVTLAPGGTSKVITYAVKANADMVQSQYFFTANRPYIVTGVNMRWSTKSSVSGLKLTVTNDTTTSAAGAGTSVLTDNTNAGPLVTQTANTTYAGALSTTAASVRLLTGNRLAIHFSGATLTALVGLVVTVTLQETAATRYEVPFYLGHIPGQTDMTGWVAGYFWTADRDYEVLDIRMIADVAAGAAAKVGVTAESGTTAAGSGTALVTDNSSAGFDLNATARTVQVGTLPVLGSRFLLAGDRLSVKPSGTLTTAAGVSITVALAPR